MAGLIPFFWNLFLSCFLNPWSCSCMEIPLYCFEFIDTKEFQRLRGLHQLGVTNYVFTNATHTRFEHSMGVSYLANQCIKNIRNRQPELHVTDREVKLITLAGLTHDIGMAPNLLNLLFDVYLIRSWLL